MSFIPYGIVKLFQTFGGTRENRLAMNANLKALTDAVQPIVFEITGEVIVGNEEEVSIIVLNLVATRAGQRVTDHLDVRVLVCENRTILSSINFPEKPDPYLSNMSMLGEQGWYTVTMEDGTRDVQFGYSMSGQVEDDVLYLAIVRPDGVVQFSEGYALPAGIGPEPDDE